MNEQQKADHELVWEYTGGTVTPRPECHAPVTADCRIEWVCGCETLVIIARDNDGPYHQAGDAKHYGKPGAECNVVVWMDNDEELIRARQSETPRHDGGAVMNGFDDPEVT